MSFSRDIQELTFFVIMASNPNIIREPLRHTHQYGVSYEVYPELKLLCAQVVEHSLKEFSKNFGDILSLVNTTVDPWAVHSLLQFYDPPLRCFTFQDYQLLPTLEEYADILKIKVLNQVPFVQVPVTTDLEAIMKTLYLSRNDIKVFWRPNGDTFGFQAKFLQRKAKEFADKGEWVAFNSLVAILIYGLVLFPSVPNFVDSDAVHIFMGKNPVPTLLADTYYIIHSKYGTKKSINCCLPL